MDAEATIYNDPISTGARTASARVTPHGERGYTSLLINGSITWRCETALRSQAINGPLLGCIQERNDW
jgi:hypothetical protein